MKTLRSASIFATVATLAFCAGVRLQAQPRDRDNQFRDRDSSNSNYPIWEQPQTQPSERGRVQRINPQAESFGMQRLAGRPVRSRNGEELSTITDFLVDPQTGKVHFAILPSGGGPRGMTYRIVPISAFSSANDNALTLSLDRAQWDRVGTMEESQLKDRVTIDVDHQQRLSRQLGLSMAAVYDGHGPAELVRATSLRGETIRSGNGEVGRVADVVVDVNRHESALVLSMNLSFVGAGAGGADQRYVVPFQNLGKRERGAWSSQLRREDFLPPDRNDRMPPPMADDRGRDYNGHDYSYNMSYRSRDQAGDIMGAATAVKENLDRSWARGRIDVVPEGSHLVLRGMLDSDEDRMEVERMVSRTAPGVRIENQIAVRRR